MGMGLVVIMIFTLFFLFYQTYFDEKNPFLESKSCKPDEFACMDERGEKPTCIAQGWTCDNEYDCMDGSDESWELCE